jgi:hypothetical protein
MTTLGVPLLGITALLRLASQVDNGRLMSFVSFRVTLWIIP